MGRFYPPQDFIALKGLGEDVERGKKIRKEGETTTKKNREEENDLTNREESN